MPGPAANVPGRLVMVWRIVGTAAAPAAAARATAATGASPAVTAAAATAPVVVAATTPGTGRGRGTGVVGPGGSRRAGVVARDVVARVRGAAVVVPAVLDDGRGPRLRRLRAEGDRLRRQADVAAGNRVRRERDGAGRDDAGDPEEDGEKPFPGGHPLTVGTPS